MNDTKLTTPILLELLNDFQYLAGFKPTPYIVFNERNMKHEIWYCYSNNVSEQNMHCMASPHYDVEYDSASLFTHVWDLGGNPVYPYEAPTCDRVINSYNNPQYVDEHGSPVCPQCHCLVMPNRGQGCMCESCNHEALIEFQHDYDSGELAT